MQVFEHVDGTQTLVVEEPPTHEGSHPLTLSAWAEHLSLQQKGDAAASVPARKTGEVSYSLERPGQQPVASSRRSLLNSQANILEKREEAKEVSADTSTASEDPYPIPESEWRFIPEYVGSLFHGKTMKWQANSYKESACFPSMTAVAGGVQSSESNNNTIVITFRLGHAKSVLCSDLYLLATPTSWHVQRITHKVLSY